MKNITLLTLLAGFIVLMSCGSDEGDAKLGLTLDETLYSDFNNYYEDNGTDYYGPQFRKDGASEHTHRRFEIILTDGELDVEDCWPSESYNYWINLTLNSPGTTETLQNGEYAIEIYGSCCEDRTGDAFGQLDGYFEDTPNYYYIGSVGTVTLSGTFPNNLTADVDVEIYYYDEGTSRTDEIPSTKLSLSGKFKGALVDRCLGEL